MDDHKKDFDQTDQEILMLEAKEKVDQAETDLYLAQEEKKRKECSRNPGFKLFLSQIKKLSSPEIKELLATDNDGLFDDYYFEFEINHLFNIYLGGDARHFDFDSEKMLKRKYTDILNTYNLMSEQKYYDLHYKLHETMLKVRASINKDVKRGVEKEIYHTRDEMMLLIEKYFEVNSNAEKLKG